MLRWHMIQIAALILASPRIAHMRMRRVHHKVRTHTHANDIEMIACHFDSGRSSSGSRRAAVVESQAHVPGFAAERAQRGADTRYQVQTAARWKTLCTSSNTSTRASVAPEVQSSCIAENTRHVVRSVSSRLHDTSGDQHRGAHGRRPG
jgi:hypothetical protein